MLDPADPARIAVLTFHQAPGRNETLKYLRLGPLAMENHRQYCQRHGYTFLDRAPLPVDRPLCWAKIPALLDALEHHQWVLWADSDTLILDPSRPLDDFLDPRYDLVAQCPRRRLAAFGVAPERALDIEPLNTGVFLLRATPWSRDLLRQAWEETLYICRDEIWNGIGDQEALTAVLRRDPNARAYTRHVETLQAHPRFLRSAEPTSTDHSPGTLFAHLYGNHARHRIPPAQCEQILLRWEAAVAAGEPLAATFSTTDLARLHYACIQNLSLEASVTRGDIEDFHYTLDQILPARASAHA